MRHLLLILIALTGLAAQPAMPADVLDQQASVWVQRVGKIRVAPDPDFAPIDFYDARGRNSGLSADLLRLLAQRTGLKIEDRREPGFAAARSALMEGRVDVLSSVFQTTQRSADMLFSTPYLRLPAAVIGRADSASVDGLADLKGRRIAVVRDHVWQELLIEAGYADELFPAATLEQALADVADGRADAYVGDLFTADYALRKSGLGSQLTVIGETGMEAALAFAVRRDLPDLKRVLDQALASISLAEESALRARWESPGADETIDPGIEIPVSVSQELNELRKLVPAQIEWTDDERAQALAQIDDALRQDSEAETSIKQMDSLRMDAGVARAEVERQRPANAGQASAEELLRWRGSLPQRASLNDLEQLLSTEQAARTGLQEALTTLTQQIGQWQQRPAVLKRELAELATRLDRLEPGDPGTELRSKIQQAARRAEIRALRARQALLLVEQGQLDWLTQGAELRKLDRARSLSVRDERIATLEQLIAERSGSELDAEVERLRGQVEQFANAPAALRNLALENLQSGEQLMRQTQRLARLREQVQKLSSQAAQVNLALSNVQARIAIGGVTDSVGVLLLAERRKLPNAEVLRAQRNALEREAADVRLAQIALSEERDALTDLRTSVALRTGSDADNEVQLEPERRAQLNDLLLLRGQLLPRLQQQYQRVEEALVESNSHLEHLLADGPALASLLEQHLLWIPSHRPVSAGWLSRLREDALDLAGPGRWKTTWDKVATRLPEKPVWVLSLLLPLLLLLVRPRIDRKLAVLAAQLRSVKSDRFQYTLQALLLGLVRAAPMALFYLALGHILQAVGEGGRFTHSVGRALTMMVPYLYFFALISVICRQQGLAQAHLRWPRARRAALLRLRPYLYGWLVPLIFLTGLCFAREVDNVNGTLLLALLAGLHGTLAAMSWWLLHPDRLLAVRGGGPGQHPKLRRWLRLGVSLSFLAMAFLPLLGYVVTAGVLLKISLNTLEVVFAVTLAHGLILRWLVLGERRVALAQQQANDGSGEKPETAGANLDAPGVGQESVDVRLVSTQSRSLLRAATVLLLGSGLLWSLADVAPAFALLDRVVLWSTSELINGTTQIRDVSLGSLTLAVIALILGISATRNIPGLLEIVLLTRFTQDASVRYAVVTVTRYVITFLALVTVFGLLGLRWGHLQWLAAGFSVGLGFGLQEIFGNFVAGLILLFERPFRVGDVVTIGDLSGTVRRIRTRATTIVDFDNKDIVIPNKTLITERFVNWTLTDTTTRIIIKVGVSYDSDPKQVRETLLAIARAHPTILPEPAPVALFVALADSTLNFELRCFVQEIGDRLRTTDDLHSRIIEAFRAQRISIAFPQLDLHLHQVLAASEPGSPVTP
jgi:potassium-dependent mechanosensitive channel